MAQEKCFMGGDGFFKKGREKGETYREGLCYQDVRGGGFLEKKKHLGKKGLAKKTRRNRNKPRGGAFPNKERLDGGGGVPTKFIRRGPDLGSPKS